MIDTDSEEDCSMTDVEDIMFTKLTEIVRNQYMKRLLKQLEDNLRSYWRASCFADESHELGGGPRTSNRDIELLVQKCAQNMENLALQEASLTQLYQKAMKKAINSVRRCTKEFRIFKEMQLIMNLTEAKESKSNCNTATKATQTEYFKNPVQSLTVNETKATQTEGYKNPAQTLTLDERITLLQKQLNQIQYSAKTTLQTEEKDTFKLNREKRKRPTNCRNIINDISFKRNRNKNSLKTPVLHSSTTLPPVAAIKTLEEQLEGDEIAEELEKLFMEHETDLEEILGISLESNHSNSDTAISPTQKASNKIVDQNKNQTTAAVNVGKENFIKDATATNKLNITNSQHNQIYRQPVDDLRESLWPAECYMRKRRLSEKLTRLFDKDKRLFHKIKTQFSFFFGEPADKNVDFEQYCPPIEMDEIVICSSVRRISPWVVKHLIKPLEDGLIGNRIILKILAKKLAYRIIIEDQYPNESAIKKAVEKFFFIKGAVKTVDDVNDIDSLSIVSTD